MDPSINQHLDATIVSEVYTAVNQYNNLPLSERQPTRTASNRSQITPDYPGGGCTYETNVQQHWWGQSVQINECLVLTIEAADATVAYVSAAIALGCLAFAQVECSAAAGAAAVVAMAQQGYISAQDNKCGNQGVFINLPRVGPPWIASIC